jgi:hypothetical protein
MERRSRGRILGGGGGGLENPGKLNRSERS